MLWPDPLSRAAHVRADRSDPHSTQHHELSLLRDEDCDNGQGFLLARPLAP